MSLWEKVSDLDALLPEFMVGLEKQQGSGLLGTAAERAVASSGLHIFDIHMQMFP